MLPFFHIYVGVSPPFVGVAVKVTDDPAHIVVADASTDTLAGRLGLTVIVTSFEVAVLFVVQIVLSDVIIGLNLII